jgi:hypothetical protein
MDFSNFGHCLQVVQTSYVTQLLPHLPRYIFAKLSFYMKI